MSARQSRFTHSPRKLPRHLVNVADDLESIAADLALRLFGSDGDKVADYDKCLAKLALPRLREEGLPRNVADLGRLLEHFRHAPFMLIPAAYRAAPTHALVMAAREKAGRDRAPVQV